MAKTYLVPVELVPQSTDSVQSPPSGETVAPGTLYFDQDTGKLKILLSTGWRDVD